MTMLADLLEDGQITSTLPEAAQPMFTLMVELLGDIDARIATLDREIARRVKEDEDARRLMTIPGIGPIAATAILALAPSTCAEPFPSRLTFRLLIGPLSGHTRWRRRARLSREDTKTGHNGYDGV